MTQTRRTFVITGTAAAVAAAAPPWLRRTGVVEPGRPRDVARITELDLRALAARAVDAARSAGAAYADVRLTHTYDRRVDPRGFIRDAEEMAVGVRALVNGYWGFAASPAWTADEMARLGREAVDLAKVNAATGKPRAVDLAPVRGNETGHWQTPMRIDPFSVPVDEILDFLRAFRVYGEENFPGVGIEISCGFTRQEKAFASTLDAFVTQALTTIGAGFAIRSPHAPRGELDGAASDLLLPAGRGWEHVRDNEGALRAEIPRLMAQLEADWRLPWKPVDVGRYDLVLDAAGMAELVDATLGTATELDRALGYEANAGGTSYLDDPLAMLETLPVASPLVTLTGTRATPGGLATVQWDDEGVRPDDFTLVKEGVLSDYQTTREAAGWLREAYAKRGRTLRSHGCANAQSALYTSMLFPPNLRLEPGTQEGGLEDLLAGVDRGVYVRGLGLGLDFQQRSGWSVGGLFYEVKGGKKVARLEHAGLLFRSTELWKALTALGGPGSLRWRPAERGKGEPAQQATYSVGAVPARFQAQTIIDSWRKA
jgi:TldD protein